MISNLQALGKEMFPDVPIESLTLDRNQFKRVVRSNTPLLSRAFKDQFVIPEFSYFCKQIEQLYEKIKLNEGGEVASYIPQLARWVTQKKGIDLFNLKGLLCLGNWMCKKSFIRNSF